MQGFFLLNNLGQGLHLSAEDFKVGVRKKDAFSRARRPFYFYFEKVLLFKILCITLALRSLTAEIAIKCFSLWKGVNSLIMLRICCERKKKLKRESFAEMSTLIICVFASHYVSHKTKNSNSAICDHGIHTSKVSY
jgi:hypothetical protein